MPNTMPVNDHPAITQWILERARQQGFCRVFPVAAITRGSAGEELTPFGQLKDAGAVAFSDDGRPVMNSQVMRMALESARALDVPLISHAEDLNLTAGGVMNEGLVSAASGLRGIPAVAEEVMIARDLLLAELTRARLHIAHVSTAGSVRLIRHAKKRGIAVTAETAPHYFSLTDNALITLDPVYKMNPPLRSPEDVLAIKQGLADGTLDSIATDHAPHSTLEKNLEFEYAANGVIGLESALPLILQLVHEGILNPTEAIAKITCNPANILGIPGGALLLGQPADLTLIDPNHIYSIDRETFRSKSRNCPFQGREVRGRVEMTIVQGRLAFARPGQAY
jgi:dihydroorotase